MRFGPSASTSRQYQCAKAGLFSNAAQVAARWRLRTLADDLADRVVERRAAFKLTVPAAVQLLITACAAVSEDERAAALGRHLRRLANSGLDREEFAQLAGMVELLENARPEWVGEIEAVRSGALLGE